MATASALEGSRRNGCCCANAAGVSLGFGGPNMASHSTAADGEERHTHQHKPVVAATSGGAASENQASVHDPVCGMAVDPYTTPHRHNHNGRPYYFCSAG